MPTGKTTRTTRTTKTNLRGVVKVKIKGGGVNLKQKTTKSGKRKIKGTATTTKRGVKLKVREKGRVVKSTAKKNRKTY